MTARHNIRIANRRLGRERAAIDATPAPSVGEMLQNARERKGVDLFRAERDTKIRLKYLAALEDSDYDALPPVVYTKGFLRNYAIYLGLDPEDTLTRWRDETQLGRKADRPAVAPPPQPLAAPRRVIAITPGLLVDLMFSLVVLAVFGWIGWQLMRFADQPELFLTNPAALVSTVSEDTIVLTGTAGGRDEVTITTPDGRRMTVIADADGNWSREVELSKGRNDFSIVAADAVTHRPSNPISLIVNVPLPGASPGASSAPTPAPVRLTVGWPADNITVNDGQLTVRGTTTGTRVTISTSFLASVDGSATPAPTAAPTPTLPPGASPTPTVAPDASPTPTGLPTPTMPPLYDLTIDSSGAFAQAVDLPAGQWQITITASAASVAPVQEARTVTVKPVAPTSMNMVITAANGSSWLRAIADGVVMKASEWGGPILERGTTLTVNATT